MPENPLVTVVCLCYNHVQFVAASIRSVLDQTYRAIELIVVDDASTDGSKAVIRQIVQDNPAIVFIDSKENQGNCRAFNQGLSLAKGQFIVDLAADDLFEPTRIEKQLARFDQLPDDYGVVYTNATYINAEDQFLRDHAGYLIRNGLVTEMPEGNIYERLIHRYFVSAPTMLVRRAVFDELNGYDEALAYEDFDFWIRSARNWKYAYLDEPLTKVRELSGSKSARWYQPGDKQLHSTYRVCKKIKALNRIKEEDQRLAERLKYEIRQAVFSGNGYEAGLFYELLSTLEANSLYKWLVRISRLKLPLAPLRKFYHLVRYGR